MSAPTTAESWVVRRPTSTGSLRRAPFLPTATGRPVAPLGAQLPYLTGEADESPRHEFFYYGERELYALRYNNWKVHFATKDDWFKGQLVPPTFPQMVNLRADPFEQAMEAPGYPLYAGEKLWTLQPASFILKQHVDTFEEFPPSQAPPGFNPQAMAAAALKAAANRQGN